MYKEQNMMKARILQSKGYKQKEIAEIIEVSERTVRNYLKHPPEPRRKRARKSKLDPYKDYITSIIKDTPYYNCEILYEKIAHAGYRGKISILRDYDFKIRAGIIREAVNRYETTPGYQAQVDWKEHGKQNVGGKEGKLYSFQMALGYSRMPFITFTTSMKSDVMRACHIDAFKFFGGVPEVILYDNMKTAFVADINGVFHPQKALLELAAHYGFTPERCRVRRPQTKGKVERTIGFMLTNFWPRIEGRGMGMDELNEEVMRWIKTIRDKPIQGIGESRSERFEKEKEALKPLPPYDLDVRPVIPCMVNRESCITHETNRYSINPAFIGKIVELRPDRRRRTAELFYEGISIRTIDLVEPGFHARILYPEDKNEILGRWADDRKKHDKWSSKKRTHKQNTEVEVRHPSVYDKLLDVQGGVQ
jgi:transposase